jgi:transposase-like protein
MKERGGLTRAFHVPAANPESITPHVIRNVALGSQISADESRAYNALEPFFFVERINHSRGEYVRGHVTTNAIESLWSIVKRTYIGTHHWWSRKHTQKYLDACSFRQNHDFGYHVDTLLNMGMNPQAVLPYRGLIA